MFDYKYFQSLQTLLKGDCFVRAALGTISGQNWMGPYPDPTQDANATVRVTQPALSLQLTSLRYEAQPITCKH